MFFEFEVIYKYLVNIFSYFWNFWDVDFIYNWLCFYYCDI